ncbi:unnamed protein product [Moneuplotes crassus]|uniref:UBX domain-containing protein n=1 Tax=Euplotes crassus TaxID=5936 RepID=A0AAD1X8J9_EUPCR|nr:unnamed protein product [Moneuplotes crassus]
MEDEKNESIQNFKAMAECDDDGIAFQYLDSNNWDLAQAYDQYQNTHQFNQSNPANTPAPTSFPGGADVDMSPGADAEESAFDDIPDIPNIGIPQMDQPSPVPQESNAPGSGLGNITSQFSNFASSIQSNLQNLTGGMFSGVMGGGMMGTGMNTQSNFSNRNLTAAQEFLFQFRKKNGMHVILPKFVNNTFEEIGQESKRLRRPVFFYLHNDKGDSCNIVDQSVIGEEMTRMLLNKYICVGVNKFQKRHLSESPILMKMGRFKIGSRSGDEINVMALSEMDEAASGVFNAIFDGDTTDLTFHIEDSNLQLLETEEFKAEISAQMGDRTFDGYNEEPPRRRGPEIDPTTGFPVGMTPQQIQDKILKDQQRQEYAEIDEKNKVLIEERKKKQEENNLKRKEELEKKAKIEKLEEEKKEMAEIVRSNLPEEPSEGTPDTITIQFRFPDGNHKQVRRFYKTDKVQLLYDYITSFGNENGFEAAHTHFSIIQNFPKKFFEDMNKTLEEEGLSNCTLMIKEHSHVE